MALCRLSRCLCNLILCAWALVGAECSRIGMLAKSSTECPLHSQVTDKLHTLAVMTAAIRCHTVNGPLGGCLGCSTLCALHYVG